MKELEKLNDLLTFADDSCITTENMFDLRKAINCLDLELRKLGVKLNPMKSQIMTNVRSFDKTETESIEVYKTDEPGRYFRMKDNWTSHMKVMNAPERKTAVKQAGFKKGKYDWINHQTNLSKISDG